MIDTVRVYVADNLSFKQSIRYSLATAFFNKRVQCVFTGDRESAQISVGTSGSDDILVSKEFYDSLAKGRFSPEDCLCPNAELVTVDGNPDYLSTLFYLINSLQEYNSTATDNLGRFSYSHSLQKKNGNVLYNYVQQLINDLFASNKILSRLHTGQRKSTIFLTHDIDSVYGALKQDGYYALKHGKISNLLAIFYNSLLSRPDWLNMDKIMKIEDEYGFRSTFYWLLINDKKNSDYNFRSPAIQKQFKNINHLGWENGLHKSVAPLTFTQEIDLLGEKPLGNRYHYLKFNLPQGYNAIEKSGIKLDSTLAFTEATGFRNSYGLPFMPFNLKAGKVYDFVEVPQLVMDQTFFRERVPVEKTKQQLMDFFENNKTNCVFTINWHNNFFSELKFKGYLQLYKDLLSYFKESGIKHTTQKQLIEEYYRPEMYANDN